MPNQMFQFPMYQKSQGMPGAYGNPLAGLMDGEKEQAVAQPEKPNPFQMIPTRFNPLQKEQQMQRNKTNLQSLEMPQMEGVPSFDAIRKNPSYTRT